MLYNTVIIKFGEFSTETRCVGAFFNIFKSLIFWHLWFTVLGVQHIHWSYYTMPTNDTKWVGLPYMQIIHTVPICFWCSLDANLISTWCQSPLFHFITMLTEDYQDSPVFHKCFSRITVFLEPAWMDIILYWWASCLSHTLQWILAEFSASSLNDSSVANLYVMSGTCITLTSRFRKSYCVP